MIEPRAMDVRRPWGRAAPIAAALLALVAALLGGSPDVAAADGVPAVWSTPPDSDAAPIGAPRAAAATHYAVITHPKTRTSDVTLAQLRRIYLGEQQFWPGGARIVLFVPAPGAGERAVVLRHLYGMTDAEFMRYWIAKTFRDDVAAGPKVVSTAALARRLAATIPGSVAVIAASEVDASVKVVRIDGHLPGADGYPLVGAP